MARKEDNLIPQAHKITVEEASKGGKRSAEVRREKRDLRRALEVLLDKEYTDKKSGNVQTGAELLAFKQFQKALEGDTKAFEVVRDTAGQKPMERLNITANDDETIKEMQDFFSQKKEGAKSVDND